MRINIQAITFNASEKLIDFTQDKVSKLGHYSSRILDAEVFLKVDKSDERNNKCCEIRLSIPGNDLFASRQCPSFEEAVMTTVDALKQQLVSWKERTQDRTQTAPADRLNLENQ